MRIVELILDEAKNVMGVDAISIVESPAIEKDFIALKSEELKLAEINKEKKILMGPLLIPNKPIFRTQEDEDYYIYFSRETVEKASQLYLQNNNQSNSTLEHQHEINGLTLVESWIVEDKKHDKSAKYGFDVPVGTWMGSVKVNNDEVWNEYVKSGKVKGFSIEGYFADKMEMKKQEKKYSVEGLSKALLKQIENIVNGVDLASMVIDENFAVIDDRLAYAEKEKAEQIAEDIGCSGSHEHEFENQIWYMPCESHELKAPCWAGYEMIGFKMKNGKKVPNCVPID
jgi:hypothetical protein